MSYQDKVQAFTDEITIVNKLLMSGIVIYQDDIIHVLSMLRRSIKKLEICLEEIENYDNITIIENSDDVLSLSLLMELMFNSYETIEKKLHAHTGMYYE
jgi:dihydroorotase